MKIIVLFVFFLFVAFARGKVAPGQQNYVPQRIVGGSVTTINQYPGIAGMLFNQRGFSSTYTQWCAGNILTTRAILSAAHCFIDINFDLWSMILHNPSWWRVRVGSTFANSGGVVHQIDRIVLHSTYNSLRSNEGDLVILRTATTIGYVTNAVAPVTIASATYNLADNQVVWAVGWGTISTSGPTSEQLRHVQVWTVNQAECARRYGASLTANMLCSGWLDVGGRDQCQGDSGGPLYHSNVLVGVCSWGNGCAQPFYPGVNVRVSSYSNWIISTAQSL